MNFITDLQASSEATVDVIPASDHVTHWIGLIGTRTYIIASSDHIIGNISASLQIPPAFSSTPSYYIHYQ